MLDRKPPRGLFFSRGNRSVAGKTGRSGFSAALRQLQTAVGHTFKDRQLLEEALTHSTYAYENRGAAVADNERLEFLGDAVLDLAITDVLFHQSYKYAEGDMTKTRALVVRETTLALLAKTIGIGPLLLLGRGEEATGGRDKSSNLANAVEAIFGAIYLDAGFPKACQVIQSLLAEPLRLALAGDLVYDYKSRLFEQVQATNSNSTLQFQILEETGPVHERQFTAGVLVDDQLISTGTGCSKKEAEQQAARIALGRLDCDRSGCSIRPDEEDTTGG